MIARLLLLPLLFSASVALGVSIPDRATVQIARIKAATVSGKATAMIQVPAGGRKISGGFGWFSNPLPDDFICIDILDATKTVVIGTYTDGETPAPNHGWYFPVVQPVVEIKPLVDFGTLPAGAWLRLVAEKGDLSADTFRVNIFWGKP